MNKYYLIVLAVTLWFGYSQVGAAEKDLPEGAKIMLEFKCNQCHSVKSLGIKVDESIKDEEVDEEDKDAPKPPDLGEVDPERDPGVKHDKKWTSKYLRKKVAIKERYHTKRFKGDKEQRKVLINWLFTLRK